MADAFAVKFKSKAFQKRLDKKIKDLSDFSRPLRKSLKFMTTSIIGGTKRKQVETADVGQQKFKKLSPKYKAFKAKKFGPRTRILVATGLMLQPAWFVRRVGKLIGALRYDASDKIMARALTHQKPITSKVPRRKWFGFRRGDEKKVLATITKHVNRLLAK